MLPGVGELNTIAAHTRMSLFVVQRVAVCCSVLQCVAVCCSVLQCVAVCYSVLLTHEYHYVYLLYIITTHTRVCL